MREEGVQRRCVRGYYSSGCYINQCMCEQKVDYEGNIGVVIGEGVTVPSAAPLAIVDAQAAKIDVIIGESLGAIATTTPRSSPRSPSTITKSPGLTLPGAAGERMKQRWQRLNCTYHGEKRGVGG